ncbi:hypothetical protein COV88_02985 [Candidatus Saccharibacteria bacterium CG11_big_fil_rev_8_21_14_0_20_41_19]|nr:hypothetical protein [Candidatus Saccharibacteria bacterium]OIP85538.1 MAG: hypothetical protein AUK57_03445 [Candidatus Saccharibacteria bacterium CG2_30_41_52]PIQ70699.1 MAG: hypothetical protein COV88_02985 [Candidatus Saccharibacteria bacterium CG11_big_fil_rev_8_21_14_0_20_41_19]PIZ59280.1 MAG: hypothetical protein COY18_03705 [Candidatus Saccharibacteria bacterium CG_4_10_14_0_2_um_filter_41_11]PJC30054.1 MAG: hypothetical protein CO052_00070 [Candidatus Saccharibacteria bacterium CG_4
MSEFHALVIDKSLVSLDILDNLTVLSQTTAGSLVIYKILVNENDLISTIKTIQSGMYDANWYLHFYNSDGSKLVVVFKNKFFITDNNPINWFAILEYGKEVGTPAEQLDFVPNRFQDEEF